MRQGIRTKKGEVLPINGARLLVKQTDGKEMIYQIELSTQISGDIRPGNRIEAKVNAVVGEQHALVSHIDSGSLRDLCFSSIHHDKLCPTKLPAHRTKESGPRGGHFYRQSWYTSHTTVQHPGSHSTSTSRQMVQVRSGQP